MFKHRRDAGRQLASCLSHYRDDPNVVVVGLPRGGVPVADEVAAVLHAPLDVIVVRKLGIPFQPEVAMGAIGEHGARYVDGDLVARAGVTAEQFAEVERREREELEWRSHRFRAGRPSVSLLDRVVIIVDDGVATGSTARAACHVARSAGASRVELAVPVAPSDWAERLHDAADEYVAVETHWRFGSVGLFYRDFAQTPDAEVIECLRSAAERRHADDPGTQRPPPVVERHVDVVVDADGVSLDGYLNVPEHARGLVVFAHGSGSSRHSSRNRFVAKTLNDARIATLLFDLLTVDEESSPEHVFDVALLGDRLAATLEWVRRDEALASLPLGLFGASTGAAAALWAAATPGSDVAAVVSRGGRPDLAGLRLAEVRSPTLLIVGGQDTRVLELNREALGHLDGGASIVQVPGATHLFEEPGALAVVAELARDFFVEHLTT
jgi:putative phosphoribosyl transferase